MSQADEVYKAADELGEHFSDAYTKYGLDDDILMETAKVLDEIVSNETGSAGQEQS